MMDLMKDTVSTLLEKEDFEILNELCAVDVLRGWMSCQQLKFGLQLDILKLIAKACSCHADSQKHHEYIKRLVSLKGIVIPFISKFLSNFQKQNIDCEPMVPLKLTLDVVLSIFQCLPVSSTDFIDVIIPHLQFILKKLPEVKNELTDEITELLEQREDIFSQDKSSYNKIKENSKEPSPPCNFRDINLLPSKEEIENKVRPYLRANVVKGTYENVDHYLDVQFRLMREDMFRYFKESIGEYRSKTWPRDSSALLQNGHIYFDAQIISNYYKNGIIFVANVSIGKKVDWKTTKRLASNTLLCVSSDGFQNFAFVHVRSSSPSPNGNLCCLFEFAPADKNDDEYLKLGKVYDIIETTSFYESYRHVLKRLQLFTNENFPLSSSILYLEDFNNRPKYWRNFLFLSEMKSEQDAFQEMMSSGNPQFDKHQHKAFQVALSNQVSVIQGPPGTGKTYLGLQIVQWLVQNASNHLSTPILVICYTNHALDQFLEGILKFTEKVVRIGGQSKSPALKCYHIDNIVKALLNQASEDTSLNAEEIQSLSIGKNLLGFEDFHELESLGIYTAVMRNIEKLLKRTEEAIQQLENNPLYSENIMLQLLPKNLRQEILGWMDSWRKTEALNQFLLRCMEHWLCISRTYLHAYEDLPDLLSGIIQELLNIVRENGSFNTKVALDKCQGNAQDDIVSENKFALSLWQLFLKMGNLAPIATLKLNPIEADGYAQHFFRSHTLDKRTVFKILERSAAKCLEERNFDAELDSQPIWSNSLLERWARFFKWKSNVRHQLERELNLLKNNYIESIEEREAVKFRNNIQIAQYADVIGLTTTGAAKHWKLLEEVSPRVVVAEEAAEVLEAHITTALTKSTQHLILIGDHKQLRPTPSVYELARRFKLDVSMFERLLVNGAPSQCLQTQHRMRPCIAQLLVPEIYDDLQNHPSVLAYEDVKGMASNMYFIKHKVYEDGNDEIRSHRNKYEAAFLVSLCHYLLQQGHSEENITILTTYVGQLKLVSEMVKKLKRRVRVTTVDNYQGEENDIILLSFVRSNARNSLGFLEISNRICVALSRAKKGLFCIGNFKSFAEKCLTWRKIILKLKKMRLISSALPLKCQNHPKTITLVSCASDFDKVPDGGCTEKCMYRLACGHICPRKCHISNKDHDEMFCSEKCKEQYQSKNSNTITLFENFSDKSFIGQLRLVPNESCEADYESDDYERELDAHAEADSDLFCSEYFSAESSVLSQDRDQDSMDVTSNGNRKPEESSALNPLVTINIKNEQVDLENCSQQSHVANTSDIKENNFPLLERKEQITTNELLNSEKTPFAMNSSSSVVLPSEIPGSDSFVSPGNKSRNDPEGENTEHTCLEDVLNIRRFEDVKRDNELTVYESVVEICMSEVLLDTKFGGQSDNYKRDDKNRHLDQHTFQKDEFLQILRDECEESFDSSKGHDISRYTAVNEPEQIFETCELHNNNKKLQCDVLISKKLQCQHEVSVPCNKYNFQLDCKAVVYVQLPCLHVSSVICRDWIWLKEIRCTVNTSSLMPCGKLVHFICSEGPYHADCSAVTLKCGHGVPCYTDVNNYRCEVPVKHVFPCSHEINVPCVLNYYSKKLTSECKVEYETGNEETTVMQKLCRRRCNFLMECGHSCLGKCGDCTYDRKHRTCSRMVRRTLPCGHELECECHKKNTSILCRKRCNELMMCGHRCSGKCGTCSLNAKHEACCELVQIDLPCGHQAETVCHVKNPPCNAKCEIILSCGHYCPGRCGECFSLQIHAMCLKLVNTQLHCGHCVEWPCGSPLPVCEKRCLFGCQHSRCINSCLHPCAKCFKPCDWKCEHLACSMRCGDLCDRPACDVRCLKVLPCGHQCCGYCGEPCPNVCAICGGVPISEFGSSNWYVLLENCQHSVLMEDLNTFITQRSKHSYPMCPECGTVITRNKRFGNYIKTWLSSIRQNYSPEYETDISCSWEYDMLDELISQIIKKNISLAFIPKVVTMCRNLYALRMIKRTWFPLDCDLKREVISLEKWLSEHSVICSEQQVEESNRAVRRFCALWHLRNITSREKNSNQHFTDVLYLLESKPFGESEENKMIELLQQNSSNEEGKKNYFGELYRFIQNFVLFRTATDIRKSLQELEGVHSLPFSRRNFRSPLTGV